VEKQLHIIIFALFYKRARYLAFQVVRIASAKVFCFTHSSSASQTDYRRTDGKAISIAQR